MLDHMTVGLFLLMWWKKKKWHVVNNKNNKNKYKLVARFLGRSAVISSLAMLSITQRWWGPYQSCAQGPGTPALPRIDDNGTLPWLGVWCLGAIFFCRGDIIGPRPFGLSKGRGGLGGFCANNSWVYMVGSVQIDTICFPISRPAIEYKAHNQRQRGQIDSEALEGIAPWLRLNLRESLIFFIYFLFIYVMSLSDGFYRSGGFMW